MSGEVTPFLCCIIRFKRSSFHKAFPQTRLGGVYESFSPHLHLSPTSDSSYDSDSPCNSLLASTALFPLPVRVQKVEQSGKQGGEGDQPTVSVGCTSLSQLLPSVSQGCYQWFSRLLRWNTIQWHVLQSGKKSSG